MSARSKGRNRLTVRYFDDRVLLTDTHAWAYQVPSVSCSSPRQTSVRRSPPTYRGTRGDQDATPRCTCGSPSAVPAVNWRHRTLAPSDDGPGWRSTSRRSTSTSGRRTSGQGDLPRGAARPALGAENDSPAACCSYELHRGADRGKGAEEDALPPARSASGRTRQSAWAARSPRPRSPRGTRPPAR